MDGMGRIQICPKTGIMYLQSYDLVDGMALRSSVLLDREGSGFFGIIYVHTERRPFGLKFMASVAASGAIEWKRGKIVVRNFVV